MLTSRYKLGETLYECYKRIRHLEVTLGITSLSDKNVTTGNVSITGQLILPYITPYTVLTQSPDNLIVGTELYSLINNKLNQTIINDLGDGTVQVSLVQDLSPTSSPTFNNLDLFGVIKIAPYLHDLPSLSSFEILGSSLQETMANIRLSQDSINGSSIVLKNARNTVDNPMNVQNNDILGSLQFVGHDGSSWNQISSITTQATQNFTDISHGTNIIFKTTNNDIPTTQMSIDQNGVMKLYTTQNATDSLTGTLIVDGGVGAGGNLNIGGSLSLTGAFGYAALYLTETTNATDISTGTLIVDGGMGVNKTAHIGQQVYVTNTINSTSPTTGSAIVSGGIGISKDLYVGGNVDIDEYYIYTSGIFTDTTPSTSTSTGSLIVSGGMGIGGNLNIGGSLNVTGDLRYETLHITSTIDTTSTSTGALIIDGGLGIAKSLSMGDNIILGKTPTDLRYIKFPTSYSNGSGYLSNNLDSLSVSFNGYYDGYNWINNEPTQKSSYVRTGEGFTTLGISTSIGQKPRKIINTDYTGTTKLFYANPSIDDDSINTSFQTDANGFLNIIPTGKQIIVGDPNIDAHRIKMPMGEAGTYGYFWGGRGGTFSLSPNGYWNGSTWTDESPTRYSAQLALHVAGLIRYQISSTLGGVTGIPIIMMLSNSGELQVRTSSGSGNCSSFLTQSNGNLKIDNYLGQINFGSSISDYFKLKLATGNGITNPPGGYVGAMGPLTGTTGMAHKIMMGYNERKGITDILEIPSPDYKCSDLSVGNGYIATEIATTNGGHPYRKMVLSNDGGLSFYTANSNTNYASFKTNTDGSLFISGTGSSVTTNSVVKIWNTTVATGSTIGALVVGDGIILNKNNVIGGNITVRNGSSTESGLYPAYSFMTQDVSGSGALAIWDAGISDPDPYIKLRVDFQYSNNPGLIFSKYNMPESELKIEKTLNAQGIRLTSSLNPYNYVDLYELNNGQLLVSTTGNKVNFDASDQVVLKKTDSPSSTAAGSLAVSGGILINKILNIGDYPSKVHTVPWTTSISDNLTFWDHNYNQPDSSFPIAMVDFQTEGVNDGRTLLMSARNRAYMYSFDKSLNVVGGFNALPSDNWIVILNASTGGYTSGRERYIKLTTPDGRVSELAIDVRNGIFQETAYDPNKSAEVVVARQYRNGTTFGNNVLPVEYQYVTLSVEQTFTFTQTGSDNILTRFGLYARTGSDSFLQMFLKFTLYEGIGTGGTIRCITRALFDVKNSWRDCWMPGGILLVNGTTYTLQITAPHPFYVGNTINIGATSLIVDGIPLNDKIISFFGNCDYVSDRPVILVKRKIPGTTVELRYNAGTPTFIDTGTPDLYAYSPWLRNATADISVKKLYYNDLVKINYTPVTSFSSYNEVLSLPSTGWFKIQSISLVDILRLLAISPTGNSEYLSIKCDVINGSQEDYNVNMSPKIVVYPKIDPDLGDQIIVVPEFLDSYATTESNITAGQYCWQSFTYIDGNIIGRISLSVWAVDSPASCTGRVYNGQGTSGNILREFSFVCPTSTRTISGVNAYNDIFLGDLVAPIIGSMNAYQRVYTIYVQVVSGTVRVRNSTTSRYSGGIGNINGTNANDIGVVVYTSPQIGHEIFIYGYAETKYQFVECTAPLFVRQDMGNNVYPYGPVNYGETYNSINDANFRNEMEVLDTPTLLSLPNSDWYKVQNVPLNATFRLLVTTPNKNLEYLTIANGIVTGKKENYDVFKSPHVMVYPITTTYNLTVDYVTGHSPFYFTLTSGQYCWQSLTATGNDYITKIHINSVGVGGVATVNFRIYDGKGISGNILYEDDINVLDSTEWDALVATEINGVKWIIGQKYTIYYTVTSGSISQLYVTGWYASGIANNNGVDLGTGDIGMIIYTGAIDSYNVFIRGNTETKYQVLHSLTSYTPISYGTTTYPIGSYILNPIYNSETYIPSGTSNGSLIVSGGVGIAKNIYTYTCDITNTTNSTSTSTGALIISGGIDCRTLTCNGIKTVGSAFLAKPVNIHDTTNTSLFGTLQCDSRGLTIGPTNAGQVMIDLGSKLKFGGTIDASGTSDGTLYVAGGVGITKRLFIGATDQSTSVSTGSLVVNGGAGIGKNLYIDGNVYIDNISLNERFTSMTSSGIENINLFRFNSILPISPPITGGLHAACFSPQLGFYVVGGWLDNSNVYISYDGYRFTTYNVPTLGDGMFKIIWIPELMKFIACGRYTFYSNDGINWSTGSGTPYSTWRAVCWSRKLNKLVAVAQGGSYSLTSSSDGITWTTNTNLPLSGWYGVCYSEQLGIFVAVSSTGPYGVSVDGITWTTGSIGSGCDSVCWCPGIMLFVAGQHGGKSLYTSPNGTTWTITSDIIPALTSDVYFREIIYIADYRVIVAIGSPNSIPPTAFIYSFDGTKWYSINVPNYNTTSSIICCYSNTLKQIIIGQRNNILRSTPVYEKCVAPYTVDSSDITSGSLSVYGGCGIAKNLNIGQKLYVSNTASSSSYTTGSLLVTGGTVINKDVYVNGEVSIGGNTLTCDSINIAGTPLSIHLAGMLTGNFVGPAILPVNIYYEKIGDIVTIFCPNITGISSVSTYFTYDTCLPVNIYDSTTDRIGLCRVVNGSSAVIGTVFISKNTGQIQVWAGTSIINVFSASVTVSIQFTISYII